MKETGFEAILAARAPSSLSVASSRAIPCLLALLLCATHATVVWTQTKGGVRHPVDEYIVKEVAPNAGIPMKVTPATSPARARTLSQLLDTKTEWAIGVEDGNDEQVFGQIEDVAIDDSSRVYALDSRMNEIRLFDARGRFLSKFGRSGAGPGEFRSPRSIAVDRRGRVYVGDAGARVHLFDRVGDAHRFVKTVNVGVDPNDMCLMRDTLYIAGGRLRGSEAVHKFSREGVHVADFGQIYSSPLPLIDYQVAQGHVACNERESLVYFIPGSLVAQVYAFSSSGRAMWATPLLGFRPISIVAFPDGSYQATRPAGGYHRIGRLHVGENGDVIAQIMLDTNQKEQPGEFAAVYTYVLDGVNGAGAMNSEKIPRVAVVGGGFHLIREDSLFPRLARVGRTR